MEIVFGALVGVLAFLVGQYVLRMVLEPLARLRRTTAQISLCLLSNQRTIHNPNIGNNDTLAMEIRALAAELVSGVGEIPHYTIVVRLTFSGAFTEQDALQAAQNLNLIAYNFEDAPRSGSTEENIESMSEIRRLLKIPTNYSGKSK